jgi:uncharacterized membrane protein YjfL (UPF0719 family)
MNIENYGYYIIYALTYLLIATVMKYILDLKSVSHYSADDQISQGNLAVGLRRSGAQLGLAIAMIGVFSGSSNPDIWKDMLMTVGYGFLAMAFMLVSLLITDRALLPNVDNTVELKKGNLAVGITEFGTLVMTGILAYASIKGDAGGLISSVVYFIVGQLTLIAFILLYELVIAKNLNPVAKVSQGNTAAGVYLAGKVIAYGLILQSAIIGDGVSSSLAESALLYVEAAVAGMILLYLFELLIDWLIVTSTTVKDMINGDQLVAAVQLSLAKIGMALILGMAIL